MDKIKLSRFEIVLDSHNQTYGLGSDVKGKCVIALDGELGLSQVRMQMKGLTRVMWNEGKMINSADIKYFTMDYDFKPFGDMISKGIYEFPFCFQLPHDGIASSCYGMYGSIEYWVEAEIQTPLLSTNHKMKVNLKVEAEDVVCNDLMMPLKTSAETSDFLFHKPCSIHMDAMIDRRAYYSGEVIPVVCNVDNQSSTRVIPRVTLRQTQTFIVRKTITKEIKKQIQKSIKYERLEGLPTEPGLASKQTFLVPIPSGIGISVDCPILTVSYDLHLTVDIPSAIDLHMDLPIMITTKNVVNQYMAYNSQ